MRLIDISTKRRVTIAMFTLAVVLFGVVSFVRLKINLLPELTYPTLTVRTEYPGAAPAEIENLISKPVEETLGVVKNVNRVSSISRSGQSDVILEFDWGTNMDYAGLDVREKLDALELPLEVSRPSILRFDPSLDPIMRFGLYSEPGEEPGETPDPGSGIQLASHDAGGKDSPGGSASAGKAGSAKNAGNSTKQGNPGRSSKSRKAGSLSRSGFSEDELKILRRFAEEEIKKELEASLGVAAVKVSGGLEDEIQVLIDQARTAQLQLPVEQIAYQLRAENVNLSGGRLEEGSRQYLVRTLNQFRSVEEIGDVIVTYRDGKPVYLKDIALVRHGYKEREAITRLDGVEAVEIAIYKEGDANTVTVAREVEKRLSRIRRILPEGVHLIKVYDQATFVQQSVNDVILAAVIGGLLAIIILYFFLRSFKATVIISFSIPVSVIATFNLMYGADLTLNIMSLGGIALGIGMLLDNSIVVLENISRHRDMGKDALTAARDGASEVSTAVTAATLTTIAVFFPLVFVRGIAGQLFRDQALTVTFALLASLVVALTLIPMLASLRKGEDQGPVATPGETSRPEPTGRFAFLKRFRRKLGKVLITTVPVAVVRFVRKVVSAASRGLLFILTPLLNLFHRVYGAVEDYYPSLLKWALGHKATVIVTAVVLFAISVMLVPILGVELIPQLSQGEFSIEFKLPPGTPLEVTDAAIPTVQDAAGD